MSTAICSARRSAGGSNEISALNSCDPNSRPTLAACKIVVADDDIDSAATFAMLLTLDGHDVRTADNGLDVLAMADQFHPNLAVIDIGMPGLDGYEVARKIRMSDWGRDMVLVALTGWERKCDRKSALQAGFDFHLVKPAGISDLYQLLRETKLNY